MVWTYLPCFIVIRAYKGRIHGKCEGIYRVFKKRELQNRELQGLPVCIYLFLYSSYQCVVSLNTAQCSKFRSSQPLELRLSQMAIYALICLMVHVCNF